MKGRIFMTVINTVLLLIVPNEYRGRVLGVYGLTCPRVS